MQWIILVIGCGIGYLMIVKNREFVRLVGQNTWAERKLGPGGSFTLWKILGCIIILGVFLNATGQLQAIGNGIVSIFAPGS